MLIKDLENLDAITVFDELKNYSDKNFESLMMDIEKKKKLYFYEYTEKDYISDFNDIFAFFQSGNLESIESYLDFAYRVILEQLDDSSEFWILFSTAKLYSGYSDWIKDYSFFHKFFLSQVYCFTSLKNSFITREIIRDQRFYYLGLKQEGTIWNLVCETTEWKNDIEETELLNMEAELLNMETEGKNMN